MKILDLIFKLHQLHNVNGNLEVFVQDGMSPSDFMPVDNVDTEPSSRICLAGRPDFDQQVAVIRA